ncbi:MAG TPA: haloacid dehalogenase type II [Ktedonobacterales bacterium]
MAEVYAFDVNETLLDVAALDPLFIQLFGQSGVWREWFAQMLQLAFVTTITGDYTDFGRLGDAALDMIAARRGAALRPENLASLPGEMQRLPAHPEVPLALTRLRDAGLRLVALTNSTQEVAEAQLRNAGLRDMFEHVFSADTVLRLKPAPESYHLVASEMSVTPGEVTLIAAHAWDIAGAASAGLQTAFVSRPGMIAYPIGPAPTIAGRDLAEIAQRILSAHGA